MKCGALTISAGNAAADWARMETSVRAGVQRGERIAKCQRRVKAYSMAGFSVLGFSSGRCAVRQGGVKINVGGAFERLVRLAREISAWLRGALQTDIARESFASYNRRTNKFKNATRVVVYNRRKNKFKNSTRIAVTR
jgi:hypothetical protein